MFVCKLVKTTYVCLFGLLNLTLFFVLFCFCFCFACLVGWLLVAVVVVLLSFLLLLLLLLLLLFGVGWVGGFAMIQQSQNTPSKTEFGSHDDDDDDDDDDELQRAKILIYGLTMSKQD